MYLRVTVKILYVVICSCPTFLVHNLHSIGHIVHKDFAFQKEGYPKIFLCQLIKICKFNIMDLQFRTTSFGVLSVL